MVRSVVECREAVCAEHGREGLEEVACSGSYWFGFEEYEGG